MSNSPGPLVSETYLDIPSQRLYYLSFGLLFQAIKLFDFIQYFFSSADAFTHYGRKWLFIDFAYCIILARLRIPRLNYSKAVVVLHITSLWFLDGLLFGGISLHAATRIPGSGTSSSGFITDQLDLPSTPRPGLTDILAPLTFGLWNPTSHGPADAHLLGQHTVRMSPISTAQINPNGQTFCLSPPGNVVLVPILLNNTNPVGLRYSLTPLGYSIDEKNGKMEYVDLSAKDLKAIEQYRLDTLQLTRPEASAKRDADDYDEYDENEAADDVENPHSYLQKTQSLAHVRITKPGILRLERVVDFSNIDARLAYPSELTVVPCPRVEFVEDTVSTKGEDVRCAGQNPELELAIDIHGVPPLSLRWFKAVNGRREQFLVEGIDDGQGHTHSWSASEEKGGRIQAIPQDLRVPLAVSLDALGTHAYVLEEVVDGLGNVIPVGSESLTLMHPSPRSDTTAGVNSRNTRSFTVLRRPTMSFKYCGPGNPTSLLIGSEAFLVIGINEADASDAPWEITLQYQPLSGDDRGKRLKPWKKTMKSEMGKRELKIGVSTPGEYTIIGVRGKYCNGDVLAPESCRVVERPKPTAEIEWKRIHECSGDTGVSASLVLHGAPPFQVYYRTQRDKEPPRELSKTFPNSRGELTLQPERSGHYIYTFVHISDANYQKVELRGPSIEQVVHPLAAAELSSGQAGGTGRGKRIISSCSGSFVDVGVDLRGTGPWNIEIQITGPKSSETLQISGITTPHETLQIPIPKVVDRDGGSFDIDILSIEDSYGCKRSISSPGISVNVKRVKPTAKFYGEDGRPHATILEGEKANLPLRLTGDGPWRITYRRAEGPILTKVLNTPNDQLHVTENGVYEILDVSDSQCPGSVIAEKATYSVDWVPRPSVKLSSETEAIYETFNGSHILPPVCEGMDDHVDLELTGRPPFQIMYNIAQDSENGGIKLLDQPTFNSIQPRTLFQLHTSTPGRKYYEVKQIGDASYPLAKHKGLVIPRSERLLFEQEVLIRPSARFKNNNRMSYCLNDMFIPHDLLTADGLILLEGTPPFQLRLSVKNLAASQVHTETMELSGTTWKVDLPSYAFKSLGPHLITIESVRDASNCAQVALDTLHKSMWVDVAETATIVPFDRRENYCAGDVSQFQLEGTPPWTIGYQINGRSYSQEAKVSPFSILQQQPGEFVITSIAHQQKVCKAAVTDLRFVVHPLPSAQVGHGKGIFQDIHEGDQAEIVFTLIGEPPFTFTYQRAEPSPRKGGKPGKVLETHTVSGVTTNDYSIFSALEGTWTVTFISDRFCRYPPSQPDGTPKKQRH